MPIIAVILILLGPRAGATSIGFAVGWVVGIVAVTGITVLVATSADLGSDDDDPSTGASWAKLVLGLLLLAVGVRQWRARPRPGDDAPLPKWMAGIDRLTPVKTVGLGFLLSAVNPKNLLMCVTAGVTVAEGALDDGQQIVAVAVFTVLAASTVLVPALAYLLASARMRRPLDELKVWLQTNNATLMAVLIVVLGRRDHRQGSRRAPVSGRSGRRHPL